MPFEELVGPTVDLSWADVDGEEVSFPVLLERIAVRSERADVDITVTLASFGVTRSTIETLSADGWVWGRLPGHLATPEGHASLAARLAAVDVESSPVVAIDADRIMVARPAVLVAFDDAIPDMWRARVVGVVSPGASRTSTSQEGVEQVTLSSHFGGDAIADAGVYASRPEIRLAEPVWRLLSLPAGTLPEPPVSAASRRWRSLRADLDLDGRVTGGDLEIMSDVILGGHYDERFDLTGDGEVNMTDFLRVAEEVTP